jgi:PEP-CTERM motif
MGRKSVSATAMLFASIAQLRIVAMALIAILVTASATQASTITVPFVFDTFGTATGSGGTDTVSNGTEPSLTLADTFTSIGAGTAEGALGITSGLQVSFGISSVSSTTPVDYIVTKTVTNNTSLLWTSFEIDFGTGIETGFCPTCALENVSSVTPTSSLGVNGTEPNTNEILWSGLNFAPMTTQTFTFDVSTCASCSGGWAIYESATAVGAIPEPATWTMMLLGFAGLACAGYRTRKGIVFVA